MTKFNGNILVHIELVQKQKTPKKRHEKRRSPMSFALFLLQELPAFLDYNALVATVYADALQVVGWCVG